MISTIEWIPRGVANPNPSRFQLSKAERQFLQDNHEDEPIEKENDSDRSEESAAEDEEMMNTDKHDSSEDPDDLEQEPEITDTGKKLEDIIASLPKIDPSSLPKEFRMEDYSSDDDDGYRHVGRILLGQQNQLVGTPFDGSGNPIVDQDDYDEDLNTSDEEGRGAHYNSKHSDDDDDNDDDGDDSLQDVPDTREYIPTDIEGLEAMKFGGYNGIADYKDDDDDSVDNDSDDLDDVNLRPDDALIIVAKTEEDFASLEIHVYEEATGNLFVHHDIPLPSYPLCLAHGTINSDGQAGNYVAVGSFSPGIEIWDLDVLDVLEPECILGGEDTSASDREWMNLALGAEKRKKLITKKNARGSLRRGSHKDAVMSLSWNGIHRQVLASGSADKTVKLWDITKQAGVSGGKDAEGPATTFTHHKDKVQSVRWHPTEGTILATGSYDRTVCIVDARAQNGSLCKRAKIPADCEALAWDPNHPHLLTAASEDGTVMCWDVRNFGKTNLWSFVAHEFGGCSDISYNPRIPGMLASCAIDKTVALWDTLNIGLRHDEKPFYCGNKDMRVGKLYTVSFYSDSPWLLGCGGSGNELALWDLSSESAVVSRFSSRMDQGKTPSEANMITSLPKNDEDFEAIMAKEDSAASMARERTAKATKDPIGNKKSKSKKKKVTKKSR